MKTLSTLLRQSWQTLFRDRHSFLIIFLLQAFPGVLILVIIFSLFAAMKWIFPLFSNQIYGLIQSVATPFGIISLIIFLWLVLLVFIALQIVCYYLAQKWLTQLFLKKKITFRWIIAQWRGVWSWVGTWLSILSCFLIFFIFFWILALTAWGVLDMNNVLFLIIFAMLILWWLFLWVSLYFAIPAYFIDNSRYFQAIKNAFSLVRNRWWKTFGYVFVVLILAAIVSFLMILLENIVGYGFRYLPTSLIEMPSFGIVASIFYSLYAFAQLGINVVVQLFLSSYSFQLYSLYKKNS